MPDRWISAEALRYDSRPPSMLRSAVLSGLVNAAVLGAIVFAIRALRYGSTWDTLKHAAGFGLFWGLLSAALAIYRARRGGTR